MRKLVYVLIILLGMFSACNSTDSKTNPSSTSLPEAGILDRLKYQKQVFDTLFNNNKDKLIVFAKLTDNNEPIPIQDGNFPDNVETSFNILKDNSGLILTVSEFPFSESGDWDITFTHYFDKDGKVFAFERQTNFFNSICTDGVAYETRTEFYNSDFQLVDMTYKLVNEKNRTLQKDGCQFPYDYEYIISTDISKYLRTNRIKNSSH